MEIRHDTLRDAVALVSGYLAHDDHALSPTLTRIADDLETTDFDDVLSAFLGIILVLVDKLADHADQTPQERWNRIAASLAANLADLENEH